MANDANAALYVNIEGQMPTYSGVTNDYTPYATATDMITLTNPAGSGVMSKVSLIRVSGTATAAANMDIYVYLRTVLDTGGTSAAITTTAHDSVNSVAKTLMASYSAAPTVGTGTLIRADRIAMPSTAVAGVANEWSFAVRGGSQAIHLRPGQQIAISNAGNAVASGASLYINFEWSETISFA